MAKLLFQGHGSFRITTDNNVVIYIDPYAGDTSTTEEMKAYAALDIDYALLPIDGFYNMGPIEAAECAELIGSKHVIPIHMTPGMLFDEQKAGQFKANNRLIVRSGEEIRL